MFLIFHQCRGAYSSTLYAALMRAGFLQGKQDIFPNGIQTFPKVQINPSHRQLQIDRSIVIPPLFNNKQYKTATTNRSRIEDKHTENATVLSLHACGLNGSRLISGRSSRLLCSTHIQSSPSDSAVMPPVVMGITQSFSFRLPVHPFLSSTFF